jgi:uncharacterized protein YhaN
LTEEQGEVRQADAEERDLLRERAALEGKPTPNVAQLELTIRSLEEQLRQRRLERDAIAMAFCWVQEAADEYQGSYRQDLEQRVSGYFETLTGRPGRRIRLDEAFRVSVVEPDGQVLSPEQLSQGARDQLYLSLRLAVSDLLTDAVGLPLLLDDPFVHFDAARLRRLREALARLAETRQWVLLTHREDLAGWGERIRVEA